VLAATSHPFAEVLQDALPATDARRNLTSPAILLDGALIFGAEIRGAETMGAEMPGAGDTAPGGACTFSPQEAREIQRVIQQGLSRPSAK